MEGPMNGERKCIMAIGGHVGDAELTSGGFLATMALKGCQIVTVALTGGERGNPPGMPVEEYRIQKEKEAHSFAEMLGGEAVIFPYTDGELPDNDEVRFRLCDIIRQYRPAALLTHWKNSIHKDHETTHRIVKDAQFFAGLSGLERKNSAHFAKGPIMRKTGKIRLALKNIFIWKSQKKDLNCGKRPLTPIGLPYTALHFPIKSIMSIS